MANATAVEQAKHRVMELLGACESIVRTADDPLARHVARELDEAYDLLALERMFAR